VHGRVLQVVELQPQAAQLLVEAILERLVLRIAAAGGLLQQLAGVVDDIAQILGQTLERPGRRGISLFRVLSTG